MQYRPIFLTNIGTKIFKKIANRIQQYIKELIHHDQIEFTLWYKHWWLNIWKLISITYYTDTEYTMRNAGLEEAQVGLKIARRNINNLRYADDTTLTSKSEEELKSLLMKVKEES